MSCSDALCLQTVHVHVRDMSMRGRPVATQIGNRLPQLGHTPHLQHKQDIFFICQFSHILQIPLILPLIKGKSKVHPSTGHKDPERESRYSSTLSLTSALDGDGWSTPCPSRFIPRKETRYPLNRRLGGLQGQSGQVQKTSSPTGFDLQTFQPVTSHYTD